MDPQFLPMTQVNPFLFNCLFGQIVRIVIFFKSKENHLFVYLDFIYFNFELELIESFQSGDLYDSNPNEHALGVPQQFHQKPFRRAQIVFYK